MENLVTIDGSAGEGGGQLLRSALSLSMRTGKAFRIERIRAGRSKPGLMRQHLACVQAASVVSGGGADGAAIGNTELYFQPGAVQGGNYRFAIGSAGSTMLVLQTILLNLLSAQRPSELRIEGGTHGKAAPSTDFIEHAFFPMLRMMGADVRLSVHQPGFYPTGGGIVDVQITPTTLQPLELLTRGKLVSQHALAVSCGLRENIVERELATLARAMKLRPNQLEARQLTARTGVGNALQLCLGFSTHHIAFSALGERGISAEAVASQLAAEAKAFLAQSAPVDAHLADQLLLPLVWAGGGQFCCQEATPHLCSNAEIIHAFGAAKVAIEAQADGSSLVTVTR